MKIKRLIALSIIVCMLLGTTTSAGMKTHYLKASGEYSIGTLMNKKSFKDIVKSSDLSKKQKKEAMSLYSKDPQKLYKKYNKKLFLYGAVKVKLKNNTYTVWGKFKLKSNSGKKTYKFGKYKFKLSKNIELIAYGYYGDGEGNEKVFKGAQVKKQLKNPPQLSYSFYVSNGKVYKIDSTP